MKKNILAWPLFGLFVIFSYEILSQFPAVPVGELMSRDTMMLIHEQAQGHADLLHESEKLLPDRQTGSDNKIRIGFMGDLMFGRLVNNVISGALFDYPWGNTLSLLKANDINCANLETTFTTDTNPVPKVFNFKSNPENIKTLIAGNLNVVNLANNHSRDFGDEGLWETIKLLDDGGIKHVGAGENSQEARRPVILERKGLKIGFLGFTDNEPTWQADLEKPGVNYIDIDKGCESILSDIRNLKQVADVVVVSVHWGPNMQPRPSEKIVDCAHKIIDAGADIIHGHSAHVVQQVEWYKNKLIMYDTGDFVDDYAIDPYLHNDKSFLFLVDIDGDRGNTRPISLSLVPVLINNMQVNRVI